MTGMAYPPEPASAAPPLPASSASPLPASSGVVVVVDDPPPSVEAPPHPVYAKQEQANKAAKVSLIIVRIFSSVS